MRSRSPTRPDPSREADGLQKSRRHRRRRRVSRLVWIGVFLLLAPLAVYWFSHVAAVL